MPSLRLQRGSRWGHRLLCQQDFAFYPAIPTEIQGVPSVWLATPMRSGGQSSALARASCASAGVLLWALRWAATTWPSDGCFSAAKSSAVAVLAM